MFPSLEELKGTAPNRDLVVGVILDEFSSVAFGPEWHGVSLTPDSWMSQMLSSGAGLLFVESAWAGNDGEWKFKIAGNSGPSTQLCDLVAWCRARSIATVFWNKEDPPHYYDFLDAARLFDVVFTSDASRIPFYQSDLGHDRVYTLGFAAQPSIHNPVRPRNGWHERGVAFAGMYFAKRYPERRAQLDFLLGGALQASSSSGVGLDIYARNQQIGDQYKFPPPFDRHVIGELSYREMLSAYRFYSVFLNANSVIDSPTMCARRIFEITASGTPVITAPSAAVSTYFSPGEIFVARDDLETASTIRALTRNPALGERSVHLAQRRIWQNHTYSNRVRSILAAANVPDPASSAPPSLSIIVSTRRPNQIAHLLSQVGRQNASVDELVILTHGFSLDGNRLDSLARDHGVRDVRMLTAPSHVSLGTCLNELVLAASGDLVTKMDDDDVYGPNYLLDLVQALDYSKADLVGKAAHYMLIEDTNAIVRRFRDSEHRFVHQVMGPTMLGRRSTFRDNPFLDMRSGEDTAFQKSLVAAGGRVYAADRFNFVQVRRSSGHTWQVSSMDLLASGDIEGFGNAEEHVFL